LSVVTEDFKNGADAHVRENREFTIDELHVDFPYISQSVLYKIITVQHIQKNVYQMGSKDAHR
jgi:hypothetical protein